MKKNISYVDASKIEAIIVQSGLPCEPKASFLKVKGPTGYNVYVPLTKTVGRIDLSGFSPPLPGVTDLGDERFGNVVAQLDFSRTEAEILQTVAAVLEHMKGLEPLAKPLRRTPARKQSSATGWTLFAPKAASSSPEGELTGDDADGHPDYHHPDGSVA